MVDLGTMHRQSRLGQLWQMEDNLSSESVISDNPTQVNKLPIIEMGLVTPGCISGNAAWQNLASLTCLFLVVGATTSQQGPLQSFEHQNDCLVYQAR